MAQTARNLPAVPSGEREPSSGVISSEGKEGAEVSGAFRAPDLRLVPPVPEAEKVVTELPAERSENETAKWVREQAKLAEPKEAAATLTELTERLELLIKERRGVEDQLKRIDQPVHKAVEALQGIGLLKDTLQAFGGWKAERVRIEETIASLDDTIDKLEKDINVLVKVQNSEMIAQSKEIAKGATPDEQALINEWFQNPAAVMEGVEDELAGLVKSGELTEQEQTGWKGNELPIDTRQAIEERIRNLKEENIGLAGRQNVLEKSLKESIPRQERKGEEFLVERIAFDKRLRDRFAGEGIRSLFRFGKKKESGFLTIETELRKVEAQLSINHEAIRRAELTLKDPRRAVAEGVASEIDRFIRTREATKSERMPGAMSKAV